jgi:hypothetical protein
MARWKTVHGNSHSLAAEEAEERGEMPITRAVKTVYLACDCKRHGVTKTRVREFLQEHCNAGWHHVAGPGRVREVAYYDTNLKDEQRTELLGGSRQ